MKQNYPFRFQTIVDSARDVVIVTKASPLSLPGPEIVYVNDAFTKLTGFSKEEAIGQTPRILQSDKTEDQAKKSIRQALEKQQSVSVVLQNRTKCGQDYWLELNIFPLLDNDNKVTHYAAIERDCTHFKHAENKLRAISLRDPLTKLYNRRAMNEMLPDAFAMANISGTYFIVMTLDIDHFKSVNDRFGHNIGDEVIISVGQIITKHIAANDWAARSGGEEFIVFLANTPVNAAANDAERIRHDVSQAIFESDDGECFSVTISIGLSLCKKDDEDEWQVVKRSDRAVYDAKHLGRNRVCLA